MGAPKWWVDLNHIHSSYAVLVALAMLGATAAFLYWTGLLGAFLAVFGRFVRGCVRLGFFAWEKLLAWASWPVFLAICLALLLLGWAVVQTVPGLTLLCAA